MSLATGVGHAKVGGRGGGGGGEKWGTIGGGGGGMGERGREWRWREGKKGMPMGKKGLPMGKNVTPMGETGRGDEAPSGEGRRWR